MAEEEVQEEPKKGGKGLIIALIVIIVLLLVGVGTLAFLMMSGDKDATTDNEAVHATAEQSPYEIRAISIPENYRQFDHPEPGSPPEFFTMEKFVVNFHGEGQARFLAVDLKFMSYYPQLVGEGGEMEHLRPMLKNDIQRLLRNQRFSALNKPEGPDQLRADILAVAHGILEKQNIYPSLLEDVFMTRFVMQ